VTGPHASQFAATNAYKVKMDATFLSGAWSRLQTVPALAALTVLLLLGGWLMRRGRSSQNNSSRRPSRIPQILGSAAAFLICGYAIYNAALPIGNTSPSPIKQMVIEANADLRDDEPLLMGLVAPKKRHDIRIFYLDKLRGRREDVTREEAVQRLRDPDFHGAVVISPQYLQRMVSQYPELRNIDSSWELARTEDIVVIRVPTGHSFSK
jgi:hypothetical protein